MSLVTSHAGSSSHPTRGPGASDPLGPRHAVFQQGPEPVLPHTASRPLPSPQGTLQAQTSGPTLRQEEKIVRQAPMWDIHKPTVSALCTDFTMEGRNSGPQPARSERLCSQRGTLGAEGGAGAAPATKARRASWLRALHASPWGGAWGSV